MSESSGMRAAQSKIVHLWQAALTRRWPVYAAAAVVGVLAIAWIDGGEEPIRPIVQPVDYPAGEGGAA